MRYAAVVFDLDGTLLDTLSDLTDSVNAAYRAFGYPQRTADEVRMAVGNGSGMLIERTLPGGRKNPDFDRVLAWYSDYYPKHCQIKTAPYPGVLELLRTLTGREYALAVVSNKPDDAVRPLVRRFFGAYISVAAGEKPGVRRKPAPDTIFAALRELDLTPAEAVYVGDSEVDLKTAAAAGLDCVSVTWGFRSRELLLSAGAAQLADRPQDVLKLV